MTAAGLRRALETARSTRTETAALLLLAALEDERYLDQRTLAEASPLLARHNLAAAGCRVWEPGVGETYGVFYQGAESTAAAIAVRRTSAAGVRTRGLEPGATEQVRTALAAVWHLLNSVGKGIPNVLSQGHEVRWSGAAWVDGRSLGLATATAALSGYLGIRPDATVAASAELDERGALYPVEHLDAKLRALAACFPRVTRVAVALDQPVGDASGIEVIRCATLADAVAVFGLDAGEAALPPAPLEELKRELAGFEEVTYTTSPKGWEPLYEKARAIAADPRLRERKRAMALAWAALFATHAGRPATALELLKGVPGEVVATLGPRRVWLAIAEATAQIDETPRAAVASARRALKMTEPLVGEERERLLGKATGTLGRALMHAGELEKAEPILAAAVALNTSPEIDAVQEARSRIYLATCVRLLDRPADAIAQCELAGAALERADDRDSAAETRRYLSLELGRSLLAAGRAEAAVAELCACEHADDASHPWIGALRTLSLARRALGHNAEADALLRRCLAVAASPAAAPTIRKVAALAAFEQLGLEDVGVLRPKLAACVAEHVAGDDLRRSLRIY